MVRIPFIYQDFFKIGKNIADSKKVSGKQLVQHFFYFICDNRISVKLTFYYLEMLMWHPQDTVFKKQV